MQPKPKTPWLGLGEIARMFGVFRETVRLWVTDGTNTPSGVVRLRAIRIGARWKVRRKWLKEYLETLEKAQNVTHPPPPPVEPVDEMQARFQREKEALAERLRGGKKRKAK